MDLKIVTIRCRENNPKIEFRQRKDSEQEGLVWFLDGEKVDDQELIVQLNRANDSGAKIYFNGEEQLVFVSYTTPKYKSGKTLLNEE